MKPITREWIVVDLAYLSDFAVAFRYPGESATHDQSRDAIKRCRAFREYVRQALGIS